MLWKICFKIWLVRKFWFEIWQIVRLLFFRKLIFLRFIRFWLTITSVNAKTNFLLKKVVKDKACLRLSRQMYKWKLPHVYKLLNLWVRAIWQHTIIMEVMYRTLWSIKFGRSAVFLKIHICENKRKRTLVRIPFNFSNIFVWATRRRKAMERSWQLHSVYLILAGRRYLLQSWHLWKVTMFNRNLNLKTCVAQNIPQVSHKLLNPKLIFKYWRIKAYFDA